MPLTGTPQPELFDGDRTLPVTSITAGVDLRTVAGRLGHGGGGATTLRVYAAWVGESDRRAAEILGGRMRRPHQPMECPPPGGSRSIRCKTNGSAPGVAGGPG